MSTAVYHPSTPDQSLLWLWAIHNTANLELAGDPTEVTHTTTPDTYILHIVNQSHRPTSQDPMAPKIQWPSKHNCPTCRINGYGNVWTPRKL